MTHNPNPSAKRRGTLSGASAIQTLSEPEFIRSIRYRDQQLRASKYRADPAIVGFADALVLEAARYQIPLFAHCFVRGEQEQNRLFEEGYSKARYGQSAHNVGAAVDIIHGVRAWELERSEWQLLGDMGKEVARRKNLKLTWGGDWSFFDPAHWEIKGWRDTHRLPPI